MPSTAAGARAAADHAIRYPTHLIDARWLGGTQRLLLRPVLPQDDRLLAELMLAQSAATRRNRFHGALTPSSRLCRQMAQVDHHRQVALVVSRVDRGREQLLADARYSVADDGRSAEFALLVDERWQRHGVGGWALRALQQAAAGAGLAWLEGEVLFDNQAMLGLARRCGFACAPDPQDERLVRVQRRLAASDAQAAPPAPPGLLHRLGRVLTGRSQPLRLSARPV